MIHCPNTILLLALSAYRMMPTTEAVSDKARHSVDVSKQELNVKAIETYNTNFMALMESPCRPEFDGYFGSTSGEPLEVQYGFKLETPPLSSIMDLLDVVEDRIVDSILVHSFPSQCGYRRRLQQQSRELSSAASGFRFMKFQEVEKCEPTEGPVNFCGVFVGHVSVFGSDVHDAARHTLNLIDQILNADRPEALHPEIIQIETSEKHINVNGQHVKSAQGDDGIDVAAIGWAGLGISALLMVALFYWFVIRNEKQGDTGCSADSSRSSSKKRRSRKKGFFSENHHDEYYLEGKSLKPSYEPEAVAFGGGSRLLLTDGRPVELDFDQTSYTDHTYPDQTFSESATLTTMGMEQPRIV